MDEQSRRCRAFPARLTLVPQAIQWAVGSARELNAGNISHEWLQLALEEAVTNICRHAYQCNPHATYGVTLWREKDHLMVELTDRGAPFDPLTAQTANDTNRPEALGGLGLPLLRACIEHPRYMRQNSMNVLRFGIPITPCLLASYGGDPHVQ